MNPDVFAEWLRRQGHHVVRTQSSYWHNQASRVYQAFPYHWVKHIPIAELEGFLRSARAIGLRYSTPINSSFGQISYHAIYTHSAYDLDMLSKWTRKNVRRGLRNCQVEPISFARLADEGWLLQLDTLDRQGRSLEVSRAAWQRRCHAAMDLPGFEAWGAMVENRLAASVITFDMDDCAYMLYQQCHRNYLSMSVNNALGFVVTQALVNRPHIKSILYGLHSLDAPASVDEFKFRMGYEARPVRQRVVFHPWMAPLFNRATHRLLVQARKWRPESPAIGKSEGMIRFYLDGRQPLAQQKWPECLLDRQAKLLDE